MEDWAKKERSAMLARYSRHTLTGVRRDEQKRMRLKAWATLVVMLAIILVGSLLGAKAVGEYHAQNAVKSPVLVPEAEAAATVTNDIPRLPKAAERVIPKPQVGNMREVVAYNSVISQTDGSPCISADGSNICEMWQEGELVCAANFVPFGTRLTIEGVGTCTVRDRMNARYPQRVDVYMGYDVPAALQFGLKNLNVTIK